VLFFDITWEGHPEDSQRAVDRGTQIGLEECVELWHKKYAKRHFSRTAYSRYGIPQRTAKYNKRKRKKYGHTRPLEFTGASRRDILQYIKTIVRVSAKKGVKKATGDVYPPAHFWKYQDKLRNGGSRRGSELFITVPEEVAEMQATVQAAIAREVKAAASIKRRERIK